MNLEEYNKVKGLTYTQYCTYLKRKYGEVTGPYYSSNWVKNQKISRTKDGLYIHHIYEDHAIMLGDLNYAKLNPYEWQLAENLVYCDILEHMFLHILISEEPSEGKNANEDVGVGGVANFIVPELNDVYSGWVTKQQWRLTCHSKAINSKDLYLVLVKRFDDEYKSHPTYKPGWYKSSFNGSVAPSSGWNVSNNKEIISEIEKTLGETEIEKNSHSVKIKEDKKFTKGRRKRVHKHFKPYKIYSRDELIALFDILTDEYSDREMNDEFDLSTDSVDDVFQVEITSEIAELTRAIVAHLLEGHTKSPGLNYLCLLLVRQLIAYDELDGKTVKDIGLHVAQTYGYNAEQIEQITRNHMGEKNIFYRKGTSDLTEEFYDLLAQFFGTTVNAIKSESNQSALAYPFLSFAPINNVDEWDVLCQDCFDNVPDSVNLYSVLMLLSDPHIFNETYSIEEEKYMDYVVNILIYESIHALGLSTELRTSVSKDAEYESAFQEIDSVQIYKRYQFADEQFADFEKLFDSNNDPTRANLMESIFALYKSMYLCHEISAFGANVQLYEEFCTWISFAMRYDALKPEDSTPRLLCCKYFGQLAFNFLINEDPDQEDDFLDNLVANDFDEISNLYEEYFKNKFKFKDESDFESKVVAIWLDERQMKKFYTHNIDEYVSTNDKYSNNNYCYDYYLLSEHAQGWRVGVHPYYYASALFFPEYLSVSTIRWINDLMAGYCKNLKISPYNKNFSSKLDEYIHNFESTSYHYYSIATSISWVTK